MYCLRWCINVALKVTVLDSSYVTNTNCVSGIENYSINILNISSLLEQVK